MWFVIASLALLASVATSALDPHDPRPRVAMVMAIGLLFALFSLVVFIWLAFTTSYSLDPRTIVELCFVTRFPDWCRMQYTINSSPFLMGGATCALAVTAIASFRLKERFWPM